MSPRLAGLTAVLLKTLSHVGCYSCHWVVSGYGLPNGTVQRPR